MYSLAVVGRRPASWSLAVFVASIAATIRPGARRDRGAGCGRGRHRLGGPDRPVAASRRADCRRDAGLATDLHRRGRRGRGHGGWGVLTGHGSRRQRVLTQRGRRSTRRGARPWRSPRPVPARSSRSPMAWFMVRRGGIGRGGPVRSARWLVLVTGAVVWGALLGDFTTFHLFFGGIAVFATPVAAVAVWRVWLRLRATGHATPGDRGAPALRSRSSSSVLGLGVVRSLAHSGRQLSAGAGRDR